VWCAVAGAPRLLDLLVLTAGGGGGGLQLYVGQYLICQFSLTTFPVWLDPPPTPGMSTPRTPGGDPGGGEDPYLSPLGGLPLPLALRGGGEEPVVGCPPRVTELKDAVGARVTLKLEDGRALRCQVAAPAGASPLVEHALLALRAALAAAEYCHLLAALQARRAQARCVSLHMFHLDHLRRRIVKAAKVIRIGFGEAF
jgi:hypothetical protein